MKKPLILVVNDDGISAPGIRKLISIMNDFGNVVVTADYFGVSDISQVKIYTYVHNYNYSTNIICS